MKKLLITSDKYSFCIDGFQELANRHWKEDNLEFTVLGFAQPDSKLQGNFKFQTLGEGYNDASPWVDALLPYFLNLEEEYFFLCFEDHYLIGDVNVALMSHAAQIMEQDKDIGKIRLLPHYGYNIISAEYDGYFNLYHGKQNVVSATSLRPSIWRKDYFIELLKNPTRIMNPGQFEDKNQALFPLDTKMLMPKGCSPLYPDIDAFRKGTINPVPIGSPGEIDMDEYKLYISEEDIEVFRSNISRWEAKT